jgi:hypothetical protein
LLKEVTEALIRVWGAGRVSVRLSPNDGIQGVEDSDTYALFDHAAKVLDDLKIGFLEMRDPLPNGTFGSGIGPRRAGHLKTIFRAPSSIMLIIRWKAARRLLKRARRTPSLSGGHSLPIRIWSTVSPMGTHGPKEAILRHGTGIAQKAIPAFRPIRPDRWRWLAGLASLPARARR